MGIGYNPQIVTNGLQLYLDAGNTKSYPGSGTTWSDLSGNGYHATLVNSPTYDAANGGSINFVKASSQYATIATGALVNGVTSFTIQQWFNSSNVTPEQMLFSTMSSDASKGWLVDIYNSKTILVCYPSSAYTRPASTVLTVNTFYELTITYTPSSTAFYLNAVADGTATNAFTANTSGGYVANYYAGNLTGYTFSGKIYTTRFYNRVLSTAEIAQNFNALRGRFGI